jgi:hypothetical protein
VGVWFLRPVTRKSVVSRIWLRLVGAVSLAAYLLANTNASAAVNHWMHKQFPRTAEVASPAYEATSEKPKKCTKGCCKPNETQTTQDAEPSPPPAPVRQKQNSDKPVCPCCPNDSEEKHCPCPGGCALCSVGKAPLLTPFHFELHETAFVDHCLMTVSFEYVSPSCGGLDRPPRI